MRDQTMSRGFYLIPLGFIALVTMLALSIWQLHLDARRQIDELGTANSDSTQWFLAQAEVELWSLQQAAMAMIASDGDHVEAADALRRRFDIFYSRVQTLRVGQTYVELRHQPAVAADLDRVQQVLRAAIPVIDGDDAELRASAAAIMQQVEAISPLIRNVSLAGVKHFATDSDQRRLLVANALETLSKLVIPLFVLLVGTVMVLFLMFRAAQLQNKRITAAGNRLNSLFEASIDAILVARADGRITGYNLAAQRIYGYQPAEALGGDVLELLTPRDHQDSVEALLKRLREGGKEGHPDGSPDIVQATARHKSGRIVPVEMSMSFTEDERGPLLVAFVRDVSRRAAEQAELIEARDRAVAGEQAKSKMIAVMSHEMRTPLNGVMGTLDLLRTTPLDERQQRYLEAMEHSGRTLLRHINDVLDASRARSDQIAFSVLPVNLQDLVAGTIDGLQAQAKLHGNSLTVEFLGDQQRLVMADATRLEQIVVNLVGNAIKFTENGKIRVELDRGAGAGRVELRVIDTGIGIAEGDLKRIFDEFVTLGSTFDRRAQGTGLGLSIVRGLVDAMGGAIDVTSQPGAGTVFRVSLDLPLATASAVPQRDEDLNGIPAAGLEVLVVEDNHINQLVVGEMLRRSGCHVFEAADGVAGVEAAGRRRFDLILMDISMPRMNGVDAARAVRASGPNCRTPIVALTAHALDEDLARFREAGMDSTLVKPLKLAELSATLRQISASGPAARA